MPENPRIAAALMRMRRRFRRAPRGAAGVPDAVGEPPLRLPNAQVLPGDRLLRQPVFVLSSVRSGSTLLRVMLNTHSKVHSPHELHLSSLDVALRGRYVTQAMIELSLDNEHLQYLLWDRLLHRELNRHGKQVLVNKTPNDALMWRRIAECWPDVKFILLLRHPAAVTDSWMRARRGWTRDQVATDVLRFMDAVEDARVNFGGLTLRYEDLTVEPERELRRVCDFIGVEWEPGMLDYGSADHGNFRAGLGDWSSRIKSGKVQPVVDLPGPDEIPEPLKDISLKWGYLSPAEAPQPRSC